MVSLAHYPPSSKLSLDGSGPAGLPVLDLHPLGQVVVELLQGEEGVVHLRVVVVVEGEGDPHLVVEEEAYSFHLEEGVEVPLVLQAEGEVLLSKEEVGEEPPCHSCQVLWKVEEGEEELHERVVEGEVLRF